MIVRKASIVDIGKLWDNLTERFLWDDVFPDCTDMYKSSRASFVNIMFHHSEMFVLTLDNEDVGMFWLYKEEETGFPLISYTSLVSDIWNTYILIKDILSFIEKELISDYNAIYGRIDSQNRTAMAIAKRVGFKKVEDHSNLYKYQLKNRS